MNNPGHNNTFNKAAEGVNRDGQRRLMNTSHEWDKAAEEDLLFVERDPNEPVKPVVAGGITATSDKAKELLADTPSPAADGPTYREEIDTNDDGTPNVMAPKE